MLKFDIVTLFPDFFSGILNESILKRAIDANLVDVKLHNLRDWSNDEKHHKVDDRPYGGGPGMVLKPEPVIDAVESLIENQPAKIVLTTPIGEPYTQSIARSFAKEERILIICGHYEGYDERIREVLNPCEISIGDFVLTGGEIAAMVIVDSVSRLIPGVLGDPNSNIEDSFTGELLDHAHYTRPELYRGIKVPDVLSSGDHGKIAKWRLDSAKERTALLRPDLFEKYKSKKSK